MQKAYDETDTGREQAGAKAAVEPGDEGVRNPGEVFERDAQRHHEGNDDVTFHAEGLEDGGPGLGHCFYACSILADYAGKHHVKPRKDQRRQQKIPPVNIRQAPVSSDSRQRNLGADGTPEDTIDKYEMSGGDL